MYDRSTRRRAIELLGEGLSLNAVSKEIGVSRSAIREWRDRGIPPKQRGANCFLCTADAEAELDGGAYAALFGFYLGDGCVSRMRATYSLRVFCDRAHPGIVADVSRLVGLVHYGAGICHVAAPGMTVVQNCWNHWPCLFPQHGPGRKHERQLGMTEWQWAIVEPSASSA